MYELVGHFLIFAIVAVVGLLLPLAIGRLVRPDLPSSVKKSIYECGEPTIGSSYVQFDIRFYVVALLFLIFDVEVVFFFPWATLFGLSTQLADPTLGESVRAEYSRQFSSAVPISPESAQTFSYMGAIDILIFFGVLLVGFAYVWQRGDLEWVRAWQEKPAPSSTESSE